MLIIASIHGLKVWDHAATAEHVGFSKIFLYIHITKDGFVISDFYCVWAVWELYTVKDSNALEWIYASVVQIPCTFQ